MTFLWRGASFPAGSLDNLCYPANRDSGQKKDNKKEKFFTREEFHTVRGVFLSVREAIIENQAGVMCCRSVASGGTGSQPGR
jgi:hypothetical protein